MNRDTILAAKYQHLQQRRARTPLDAVRALASMQKRPYPVLNMVRNAPSDPVTLIGQVRPLRTPAGTLAEHYDPVAQTLRFAHAGVDAIALFTDGAVYERGLDDLMLVARGVGLPTIAQDYFLDEYHMVEARAAGASAVMLSSDVLDKHMLRTLVSATQRNLMTAIVQVRTDDQLTYALTLSPHAVALGSIEECDLNVDETRALRARVPANMRVLVTCALSSPEEVELALDINVDAVIVGTPLVSSDHALRGLSRALGRSFPPERPHGGA